jgi:hypothetical protein
MDGEKGGGGARISTTVICCSGRETRGALLHESLPDGTFVLPRTEQGIEARGRVRADKRTTPHAERMCRYFQQDRLRIRQSGEALGGSERRAIFTRRSA